MLTILSATVGCRQDPIAVQLPVVQMLSGQTMGTTYSIKLVPTEQMPPLEELAERIEQELESVNRQMSTYRDDSEISNFNAFRSLDWFSVSSQTAQTVATAIDISAASQGAFDVTVSPLVNLWGFGPQGQATSVPDQATINDTLAKCGYQHLQVRLEPPALRKDLADIEVDLSAIAKGHGVDRVAELLEDEGVRSYFVEIGGEVRTKGAKADGKPWRVGIERPTVSSRLLHMALELDDQAIATSGNYRNYYQLGNGRVAHTIDPRTGQTAYHNLASASVIADNCALADAVATTMMVLGEEQGLKAADEYAWAVLLLVHDSSAEGGFKMLTSRSFDELDKVVELFDIEEETSP
ncbi:MAG: FAD:protein FMN transferase [Planctomycetales bacterium]|nr:FAD:protein FMN transferase [Planctomycetales bacterium]